MFAPVIGLFIGWGALAVACVAALLGDKGLTTAIVLLSALGFIFFTPSLWITTVTTDFRQGGYGYVIVSAIMVFAPLVCMFLRQTGRFALGKSPSDATQP
ncbi:MAG: hypothetical protein AB7F98_19290 [Novosphingobium sp.]